MAEQVYRRSAAGRVVVAWLLASALLVVVASSGVDGVGAQSVGVAAAREVRTIYPSDLGFPEPLDVSFSPDNGDLIVLGAGGQVVLVSLDEEVRLEKQVQGGAGTPELLAFDPTDDLIILIDADGGTLSGLSGQSLRSTSGALFPEAPVALGPALGEPVGLTVDPDSGRVFVLDGAGPSVTIVDQVPTLSQATVVALAGLAGRDLVGLAFDPADGHLYTAESDGSQLYEVDLTGALIDTHDLGAAGLTRPTGMVLAPSGDSTDDPSVMSLYVVDEGAIGSAIVEVGFTQIAQASAGSVVGTVIQTMETFNWTPPSPDPAGITYDASIDRLVISDSEVNETPLYVDTNVWDVTRTGSETSKGNTLAFSNEPTGASLNPSNGHFFFSDDNAKKINEVDPGPDGKIGGGDDIVTFFDTTGAGSADPEGVAYDPADGTLWVSDGVDAEIYHFSLSGTLLGQFDVAAIGMVDPEGIGYDDRGTPQTSDDILAITDRVPDLIFQVDKAGTLLRTIDFSAAHANPKGSGVVIAPGSVTPSDRNFYIVDRRVDNQTEPTENDGLLYEINAPPLGGGGNPPVAVDDAFSTGEGVPLVGFDVVANDLDPDGDLDPSSTNTSCGGCSTPANGGLVNHGDGTFTYTPDPGFTGDDPFVYEVCDLTALCDTATVTITVTGGGGGVVDVRVAASSDDAEERATGNMSLGSSDLELVFDSGGNQTVGMRFNAITIPFGATITNAYIQFQTDESSGGAISLSVVGEDADNASTFVNVGNNITSRPITAASVSWSPPDWNVVGEQGVNQRTPNLASVVQEIVDRVGWSSGNSMVLMISGSGERVAESFNGVSAAAALLHVEFNGGGGPNPPVAVDDAFSTGEGVPLVGFDVVANDLDPDGDLDPSSTNTSCGGCSTPANGGLVNHGDGTFTYTPDPGFTGDDPFVYEVCDLTALCDTATVTITVTGGGGGVVDVRVAASSDDAEERATGNMSLGSSDLELVFDSGGNQTVGMRFNAITIPFGATITNAYIQFQTDERDSEQTDLTIVGEDADNPVTFSFPDNNITNRPTTTASVPWSSVPPWQTIGEAGPDQQTPNIASVIQEIVDRVGWSSGNSMVLMISGSGERVAESFNGVSAAAALLHVEFTT